MKVDRSNNVQNQNFGKFIKIKAPSHKIDKFRTALIENGDKFLTLKVEKKNSKPVLYLLSGKDFRKFLKLIQKVYLPTLKNNIEKYMDKKPKLMSLSEAGKKYIG